jgi:hypothetical protein
MRKEERKRKKSNQVLCPVEFSSVDFVHCISFCPVNGELDLES